MRVVFQGVPGSYSDQVARKLFPDAETAGLETFDAVFAAVQTGAAAYACVPVENSVAGRVADVYQLLPESGLFITGEHCEPIRHCLLALPGVRLEQLVSVASHIQGLQQCRAFVHRQGLKPVVHADTAGAARDLAASGNRTGAAIASRLAAQLYGLEILAEDIAGCGNNTTRFLVLATNAQIPPADTDTGWKTSLVFSLRSVPAALYKALGGFATNGVNLTKIESYLLDGQFQAARFYVDVEGHPETVAMRHALEELAFYSKDIVVLGVYRRV